MTLLEEGRDAFGEEHYDRQYFAGHVARYDGQVYSQRVLHVERFLGDVRDAVVLDLGCGVGFFGDLAARRGARVIGLDFSAVALQMCRDRHPDLAVLRGDATNVPFPSGTFDVVLLNDIIEHLSEEPGRRMIEEVWRVLKPGGRLVVDTDNDAFLMQRRGLRRLNDWLERETPQKQALSEIKKTFTSPTLHIKIYTVGELRALLESVGFRIERFDTYPYIAVPARDAVFNLPGLRQLLRGVKGDVQIFQARKDTPGR